MQTDFNSVIGGYTPDQWEDTTGIKSISSELGIKSIRSGSPFIFYWVNDEIQIIKFRDDQIPFMGSDVDWLIKFGYGLGIKADKNKESLACANNYYWVHP